MENIREKEQESLVNELKMGRGLARQLQNDLNSTSSSRETHNMLVQRILDSYEDALFMLKFSNSLGQAESASSAWSEVIDHEIVAQKEKTDRLRKRRSVQTWTIQERISPGLGWEGPLEDGYSWRKYGQKEILGARYPRNYYRCTYRYSQGCVAAKQVQRSDEDPTVFQITYRGRHTCNLSKNSPTDLLPPHPPLTVSSPNTTIEHHQQDELQPQESLFNSCTNLKKSTQDLDTHQEDSFTSFYLPSVMKNTSNNSAEKLRSTSGLSEDMAICDDIMPMNDFVRETCSLVSNHQVSHPSSYMLDSQPCATNLMATSSFVSGSSPACHFSGVREEVVHCRRLNTGTKHDLEVSDAHTSSGSSIPKLPVQYLKKLVNLLCDIYPSKLWTPNLRAECLVELNLSCRNGPQLQELVNLKHIDLSNSNFTRLPDLSRADKLQSLNLEGCGNLVEVSTIRYLTKLKYLNMEGCTSLKSLPSMRALKSLISVNLSGCTHLERLPISLGCLSRLTNLDLRNCKRIHNLPISTFRLKTLEGLNISGCLNLVKHMSNGQMREMSSSVDPGLPHPSYSLSDNSNHQMDLSDSFCSDGMPVELPENQLVHPCLHPEEEDINSRDQQLDYSPSTSVSKVLSEEDASQLDQLICEHSRQFEEEGNTNTSDSEKKASLKRKTSYEMVPTQPTLAPPLLQQQRKGLVEYMSVPVEAIHEVDAFDDVERIVETLIQQSSNMHEISNLESILSYLGELQESIPDTLVHMHNAHYSRNLFQVKLAHLGVSFVQTEQEFNLLETKIAMLSEEEEKLDAEIQCLMAKKEKLLDEKS